ncbi:hypothetical protein [Salipiger sp. PrR003]|uniref:hypothetical protein n=1 Tax=Salipiger sp. PrR003 TaxID=2706776 RepID=UPI0013DA51C6|nr:hypothetical protein [Salipiger sp. PrR003]NDV52882.1 hypothetical protein [Salipiger sp. PrR003]
MPEHNKDARDLIADASLIEKLLDGDDDAVFGDGFVVLKADAFQEMMAEPERISLEAQRMVAEAKEAEEDANRVLSNWFDQRRITQEKIGEAISNAAAGYLRTSRVGGMEQEDSDMVQGVIDDMLRQGVIFDIINRHFAHPDDQLKGVLREIEAECLRQRTEEGYTDEEDDGYFAGRLAAAAGCYMLNAADVLAGNEVPENEVPRAWTMVPEAWKPKEPKRDLIRALALGVAELKRMYRQEDAVEGEAVADKLPEEYSENLALNRHRQRLSREAALHPNLFFYSSTLRSRINKSLQTCEMADPGENGFPKRNALGSAALSLVLAGHYNLAKGDVQKFTFGGCCHHGDLETGYIPQDTADFEVTIVRTR